MKLKATSSFLTVLAVAVTAWCVQFPIAGQVASPGEINNSPWKDVPEKSRETVQKGLEFLVKQQSPEGFWDGDDGRYRVATTALAGLALYMERIDLIDRAGGGWGEDSSDTVVQKVDTRKPKTTAQLRKAADWLVAQSRRDGLIYFDHPSEASRYMEGHGLATLLLAGVYQCELARPFDKIADEAEKARLAKLKDTLARSLKYVLAAQSSQGGWYHTSKTEGHDFDAVLPTAIQLQALRALQVAGFVVPQEQYRDAHKCLKSTVGQWGKLAAGPKRNRVLETAAAVAGHEHIFVDETTRKWRKFCQSELPNPGDTKFGRDDLPVFFYTLSIAQLHNGLWTSYRDPLFDALKTAQNADGGWPASEGLSAGRVYATALWCIVLQLDRNRYPSMRRQSLGVD